MPNQWVKTAPQQVNRSLSVVRIAIAVILIIHPLMRMLEGEVHDFGEFLGSAGFPFGVAVAWLITLVSFFGSVAMIVERLVVPGCIGHIIILVVGIPMVHARHGWFVVGGGRNGMEYSVTLLVCLVAILLAYWPRSLSGKA